MDNRLLEEIHRLRDVQDYRRRVRQQFAELLVLKLTDQPSHFSAHDDVTVKRKIEYTSAKPLDEEEPGKRITMTKKRARSSRADAGTPAKRQSNGSVSKTPPRTPPKPQSSGAAATLTTTPTTRLLMKTVTDMADYREKSHALAVQKEERELMEAKHRIRMAERQAREAEWARYEKLAADSDPETAAVGKKALRRLAMQEEADREDSID